MCYTARLSNIVTDRVRKLVTALLPLAVTREIVAHPAKTFCMWPGWNLGLFSRCACGHTCLGIVLQSAVKPQQACMHGAAHLLERYGMRATGGLTRPTQNVPSALLVMPSGTPGSPSANASTCPACAHSSLVDIIPATEHNKTLLRSSSPEKLFQGHCLPVLIFNCLYQLQTSYGCNCHTSGRATNHIDIGIRVACPVLQGILALASEIIHHTSAHWQCTGAAASLPSRRPATRGTRAPSCWTRPRQSPRRPTVRRRSRTRTPPRRRASRAWPGCTTTAARWARPATRSVHSVLSTCAVTAVNRTDDRPTIPVNCAACTMRRPQAGYSEV